MTRTIHIHVIRTFAVLTSMDVSALVGRGEVVCQSRFFAAERDRMVGILLALSGVIFAAVSVCWTILRTRHLERCRREQTLFYASLGHELKTPLNCVIGYSELLQTGDCSEEERNEALRDIHFSARMLLTMIDNMLDCAKLNAGQMRLHPRPVDLNVYVSELPPLLNYLLQEKKLRLEIDVQPGLPTLVFDPDRVRQILLNLIGNAVKYSDSGTIKLQFLWHATAPARGGLVMKVSDQGHGIPQSEQKRIFDPFAQQHIHATAGTGTGLGLSITLRLIKMMGGTIALDSDLGKGSCFTVKIPDIVCDVHDRNRA